MIVAIDGPAGAGKSTIASAVARQLGFQLIDTGAIYRAVAYHGLARDIALEDAEALASLADELSFAFRFEDERNVVECNGEVLGDEIRSQEVSQAASQVSAHPPVRQALLEVQRELGRARDSVLEGRDIGTVVFPDADVKIFLTASPQVRAQRRADQLRERGMEADQEAILAEIKQRDARDTGREVAPLKQAQDARAVDSTGAAIEEVIAEILAIVEEQRG